MELQELVERIERWKRRQAGQEDSEPVRRAVKEHKAPLAAPMVVTAPHTEMGEVTDEFEVEPVTGVEPAMAMPEAASADVAYPSDSALESLPDDDADDVSGITLSEFEEVK